jgi:energy-coupling factor transporter ATP-binding protein EcfA2
MKLRKVQIKEFRSIWDSTEFDIERVTCLVGKNEAGKTSLLHALYRLNPIIDGDGEFDVTDDYPRSAVEDYTQDIEAERREHAVVVRAAFTLDESELTAIGEDLGEGVLQRPEVIVSKGYQRNENGQCERCVTVPVNEARVVQNLLSEFDLPEPVRTGASHVATVGKLAEYLADTAQTQERDAATARAEAQALPDEAQKAAALERARSLVEGESAKALRQRIKTLRQLPNLSLYIWEKFLSDKFPQFLYFDDYYQMTGHDNVEALRARQKRNQLKKSDHPLLGLIDLARLELEKLVSPERTQDLKNKLQGASNHLTKQVLKYWSQNRHLRMSFDVRPACPKDPEGMRDGTNIWGEVEDKKHLCSTGLGTRSAGFVWFFSFLAWYSSVKKRNQPLVLLLDEPGLSLHGRAQEDLLRFFEAEIVSNPKHQLLYTTHSPFMVDPQHFDRVRIVQDKGIDTDAELPRDEDGTKVFTDVLDAGPDSLFPLQGALGYDLHQTLFVGPNCLVVEGVSDLLYIQTVSAILEAAGRTGIDRRWTITPVGGSDKVPTFVALLGARKALGLATLIDFQKDDQQSIENLYKKRLLDKNRVLTYADFTGKKEADVEDMFDEEFYLRLVGEEFGVALTPSDIKSKHPRIVVRLEEHFVSNPLPKGSKYNHYRPARLLAEKPAALGLPATTLDRFERAFTALNALLR